MTLTFGEQPNVSYCDGCSSEITWGTWRNSGKRMPAHEDPKGNLILKDGFWEIAKAGVVLFPAVKRYTSHFANCPKAKEFRR